MGGIAIVDADPASPEVLAAWRAYAAELAARFPAGFDPGGLTTGVERYRPPAGACLVASRDGLLLGTAALTPLEPAGPEDDVPTPLGEVKRMWVAEQARGHGLGRRLLAVLEARARRAGYATLRLDTNETLTAAIGLYEATGYRRVPRYNDNPYATHHFEKRLFENRLG